MKAAQREYYSLVHVGNKFAPVSIVVSSHSEEWLHKEQAKHSLMKLPSFEFGSIHRSYDLIGGGGVV